jgi:uncharacterized delta-60 repeat protein
VKRGSLILRAVTLLSCGLAMAAPAAAAAGPGRPGTLDPSFGQGGLSVLRLGSAIAESSFDRVFLQADGKILVVGRFQTQTRASTVVERRLPNGELDDTFGKGGEVVLPAYVIGQESDGRLLIVGGRRRPGCAPETLRRLSFDGTEDGSFGSNGCSAEIPFSVQQAVRTADGHIYVLGTHGYGPASKAMPQSEEIGIARLAPDGSLDRSFGMGGVLFTHSGAGLELNSLIGGFSLIPLEVSGMAPMPGGGVVVVAGRAAIGFTATGALDTGFGNGGIVELGQGSEGLLSLPDGRLVVASPAGSKGIRLIRLLPSGTPDPTFGAGGISTVDDGASNGSVQIAALPDGRLLMVSSATPKSCPHFCSYAPTLARLNADGSLDRDYGEDGIAGLGPSRCAGDIPSHPGLAVGADGRTIVAAGQAIPGDESCLLARDGSGRIDRGFGRDGYVVQRYLEPSDTEVDGLAIEPSGGIVIPAMSNVGEHNDHSILLEARRDGALNRKLGSAAGFRPDPAQGEVRSGGGHGLFSIVKIHGALKVVEFDDRGRVRRHYGLGGEASLPSGFRPAFFLARPDGHVLVFGLSEGHHGMAVFRLDAHGHPDRGFGRDGLRIVGFGTEARVRSALVEPGGRIVIAGGVGHRAAAVRLLPDGRLDPAFGHRGRALHLLGRRTVATTVARRGDGIVLGCMHVEGFGRAPGSILVGLDGSGRRDPSFGHRGVNRLGGQAAPLALFGSGRRTVLLTARGAFGFDGLLVRAFGPRGTVDRSFGSQGRTVVAPPKGSTFDPFAAARQSDGRIVVAGEITHERAYSWVQLLRLR